MTPIKCDYRDLEVWQEALRISVMIKKLTSYFPATERYGLGDQMRRAADSVPLNISEGYRYFSTKKWLYHVRISFGSASELESQLIITQEAELAPAKLIAEAQVHLDWLLRLLNGLCRSLAQKKTA